MEFNELVKIRRSVRDYKEASVLEEDIKQIIETTLLAPSWKNSETGRYYVALSDETINKVFEALPDFNQHSSKNAAYIIATYKKGLSGFGQAGQSPDGLADTWGAYDLGLQNAYLCLKASELGYDTLIMGLKDNDKLKEIFNIPDDEVIMPVIAIGKRYSEPKLNKRKEVEEVLKIK